MIIQQMIYIQEFTGEFITHALPCIGKTILSYTQINVFWAQTELMLPRLYIDDSHHFVATVVGTRMFSVREAVLCAMLFFATVAIANSSSNIPETTGCTCKYNTMYIIKTRIYTTKSMFHNTIFIVHCFCCFLVFMSAPWNSVTRLGWIINA